MVDIPFPTLSSPAEMAESGGRLINVFLEKLNDGRIAKKRVPGLKKIVEISDYSQCRGFLNVNENLIVAIEDHIFNVTSNGDGTFNAVNLGSLPGSGPVFLARNNKIPTPDIVAVTEGNAYLLTLSGAPSGYPDPDVGSPNSVVFLGGYFVFSYGDARMRTTALNDTSINTLDTAFAESKPDGLVRVVNFGRDILAFGKSSVEIWRNTGNLVAFPFTYVDTLDYGAASPTAIAGFDAGYAQPLMFVGVDSIVYKMDGYRPTRVSNHAVERYISDLADKTELEACVYMHNGHPCWSLSSASWTWEYDLSSGCWYERESYNLGRWRGCYSVRAFDQWIIGDKYSGKLYAISPKYAKEGNEPLIASIISATMSPFPDQGRWNSLELDIMTGVGILFGEAPIQTLPVCRISTSLDGGVTFGDPIIRSIGRQGNYKAQVRVNNLGIVSAKGAQVRIDVSDPVDFALFAGTADIRRLGNK